MAFARPTSVLGQVGPPIIAILKPAGGFLTSDGRSVVPLQVVLRANEQRRQIVAARIVAAKGEITSLRVIDAEHVQFLYGSPRSTQGAREFLDIVLTLNNDKPVVQRLALDLPPPSPPRLDVTARPKVIEARNLSDVELTATARGTRLEGVHLAADGGHLRRRFPTAVAGEQTQTASWELPELPTAAPSHLIALAVAAQRTGFAAAVTGVSVSAPVRLSVRIPFGSRLKVEGSRSPTKPVRAPRRGRTVLKDIVVTYDDPVKAFEVKGDRRKPLSLMLPTGIVSTGLAVPIPGQAMADGGTGPTVVLSVPPGPFGARPFWPDLTVEGAPIIDVLRLSPQAVAIVLLRPSTPRTLRILLDGVLVGEVQLTSGHGQTLKTSKAALRTGERAAIRIEVLDIAGFVTSAPRPRALGPRGEELPLHRESVGVYRTALPVSTPGEPDSEAIITVELEPPRIVAGAPLAPISLPVSVRLQGPAPITRTAVESTRSAHVSPTANRSATKVGFAGAASLGTALGPLRTIGGFVQAELRLPLLGGRFGVRMAAEIGFGNASGLTDFGGQQRLQSETRVTTIALPLELVFGIIRSEAFELAAHAGGALRFDQGALEIEGDSAGGGKDTQWTARAGLEGSIGLGPGSFFLGATVAGIGGRLNALSTDTVQLDGSLTHLRGELGYRFWVFP